MLISHVEKPYSLESALLLPYECGRESLASPRLDGRWNDEVVTRPPVQARQLESAHSSVLVV
jgi:hypothetical protein